MHVVGRLRQIPFVDNEYAGLELLCDISTQLLVDSADPLRRVKQQQHNVGTAHASLCALSGMTVLSKNVLVLFFLFDIVHP